MRATTTCARTLRALLLLASGCGSTTTRGDASADAPRIPTDSGRAERCSAAGPLEIGRCVDGMGAPCTGGELDAEARFAAMEEGATLDAVIGPQASTMFALAVRAEGIAPGDPSRVFSTDNPQLVLELQDERGVTEATYRARIGFRPVPDRPGVFENPQVFFVVEEPPGALRGRTFQVLGVLEDRDGEVRCGALELATRP